MRICEVKDCNTPVFGTCKISRKGYCKRHQSLREDFDRRSLTQKAISKINKNKTNALSNKVKSFAKGEDAFRDGGKSKSELLKLADKLFSEFVINRDKDANGNINCVCCGEPFNVEQTNNVYYDKLGDKDRANNPRGDKIVQNLHFIQRGVYSLRFDEFNCHAGCSYCNFDMFHVKDGRAFKQYREYMVAQYGEEYVAEMEVAHRKINRIETVMLKTVIELYS